MAFNRRVYTSLGPSELSNSVWNWWRYGKSFSGTVSNIARIRTRDAPLYDNNPPTIVNGNKTEQVGLSGQVEGQEGIMKGIMKGVMKGIIIHCITLFTIKRLSQASQASAKLLPVQVHYRPSKLPSNSSITRDQLSIPYHYIIWVITGTSIEYLYTRAYLWTWRVLVYPILDECEYQSGQVHEYLYSQVYTCSIPC